MLFLFTRAIKNIFKKKPNTSLSKEAEPIPKIGKFGRDLIMRVKASLTTFAIFDKLAGRKLRQPYTRKSQF
uniref:Uncharacterized protein n=1 Tax=Meloidogyne incognita TaxID=6306 RepID=A0A914LVL1_MELIC